MKVDVEVGNSIYTNLEAELVDNGSTLYVSNMHNLGYKINLYGQEIDFVLDGKEKKSGRVFFHVGKELYVHIS